MGLEVASEGAGLQGREEGVEFVQVGALGHLLLLGGLNYGDGALLEIEGRKRTHIETLDKRFSQ